MAYQGDIWRWFFDGPLSEEPIAVRVAAFSFATARDASSLVRNIGLAAERFRVSSEAVTRAVECLSLGWFAIPSDRGGTWRSPGFVYAMERGDGMVKLGHSRDVDRRRLEVQRAERREIRVIAARHFPDRLAAERRLHERFTEFRKFGEWFELGADERAVVVHLLGGAVE